MGIHGEPRRRSVGKKLLVLLRFLALLTVSVGIFLLVVHHFFPEWPKVRRTRWHPRRALETVWNACYMYWERWSVYPSDVRGEEQALYKLRQSIEDHVEYFDPSYGDDATGLARFDEKTERLVGGDLEYLNWAIVNDPRTVILAEQWWVGHLNRLILKDPPVIFPEDEEWWVGQRYRYFATAEGGIGMWEVPGPDDRTRLVGRLYDDTADKLLPPQPPDAVFNTGP